MEKNKDELNKCLEKITFEIFDTINKIFEKRNSLDSSMKSGFLNISKARYSMGVNSVSSLMYNLKEDTTAKYKITIEENENDENSVELYKFNICDSLDDSLCTAFSKLDLEDSELRQRKIIDPKDKIDDFNKENILVCSEELNIQPAKKLVSMNDPLIWFGVLVPQNLKQSQKFFENAVKDVSELAELQTRLSHLQKTYKSKLAEKSL
ncbi:hypothetical protein HELRODRAFT_170970 [Helobdella robusta]|uniref:Vacuolar ATPase assembly protein VMA22 n=1 Tax=Helobdella robusta TaxID=6412 RepID=T1F3N1_HELRO|nr:hypothetical protein HELRODRAFT_170970 [Helobdella robusta]ESO06934.1 hypothetical protein HELRODRAFT_170970 [Helobdella robusta]